MSVHSRIKGMHSKYLHFLENIKTQQLDYFNFSLRWLGFDERYKIFHMLKFIQSLKDLVSSLEKLYEQPIYYQEMMFPFYEALDNIFMGKNVDSYTLDRYKTYDHSVDNTIISNVINTTNDGRSLLYFAVLVNNTDVLNKMLEQYSIEEWDFWYNKPTSELHRTFRSPSDIASRIGIELTRFSSTNVP